MSTAHGSHRENKNTQIFVWKCHLGDIDIVKRIILKFVLE